MMPFEVRPYPGYPSETHHREYQAGEELPVIIFLTRSSVANATILALGDGFKTVPQGRTYYSKEKFWRRIESNLGIIVPTKNRKKKGKS